eukprot:15443560-Alexandrium_andersonii.AAC.1
MCLNERGASQHFRGTTEAMTASNSSHPWPPTGITNKHSLHASSVNPTRQHSTQFVKRASASKGSCVHVPPASAAVAVQPASAAITGASVPAGPDANRC